MASHLQAIYDLELEGYLLVLSLLLHAVSGGSIHTIPCNNYLEPTTLLPLVMYFYIPAQCTLE